MPIQITRLPLSPVPHTNMACSIWHRINDEPYILDSTSVMVRPDGYLLTPFLIPGIFSPGDSIFVQAKSNCGRFYIEREIVVPIPITTTTTTESIEITWECESSYCETNETCPVGYTLSPDHSLCTKIEETPPVSQDTPINAAASKNNVYSQYGTRIYDEGYGADGEGPFTVIDTLNPFWRNIPSDDTHGPMNRNGIWIDDDADGIIDPLTPGVQLQVSFNLLSATGKLYYFGIGGDNKIKLTVNGVVKVNRSTISDLNFKWWHVYPVLLQAGSNLISVTGEGDGTVNDCMAMEIYENTVAELMAATDYPTLTVPFKTADLRGGVLQITQCPAGYQAINVAGVWKCQRVLSVGPTVTNTAQRICTTRRRLINGVPDGYIEDNLNGIGEGPYFPPVFDELCNIGGITTTTTTAPPTTTTTTTAPPEANAMLIDNAGNAILLNDAGDYLAI